MGCLVYQGHRGCGTMIRGVAQIVQVGVAQIVQVGVAGGCVQRMYFMNSPCNDLFVFIFSGM